MKNRIIQIVICVSIILLNNCATKMQIKSHTGKMLQGEYDGDLKNNKPHGKGEFIYTNIAVDTDRKYEKKTLAINHIRKKGGGRWGIHKVYPKLNDLFLKVVESHTAGDPRNGHI